MNTPAISLARVSRRGKRRDDDIHSLDVQQAKVRALDGYHIVREVRGIEPAGKSGKSSKLLNEAVSAIENGEAEVVIVGDASRAFRDLRDQILTLARVEAAGGLLLESNGTPILEDPDDPDGTMLSQIKGSMNQRERAMAAKKSREAIADAVELGRIPIPTPFGYMRDGQKRLILDPVTSKLVLRAFELRAEGYSVEQIRRMVPGLPSSRTVSDFFKSTTYIGTVKWNGQTFEIDPIVTPELWRAANAKQGTGRTNASESPLLLARLRVLRCVNCGRPLQAKMIKGRWGSYQCPGGAACDNPVSISSTIAEQTIIDYVKDRLRGVEEAHSGDDAIQAAAKTLERAQDALRGAIAMLQGFEDVAEAQEKLQALRAAVDAAQADYDKAAARHDATSVAMSVDDWDSLTIDGRRDLIKAVVESATVAPGRGANRITFVARV